MNNVLKAVPGSRGESLYKDHQGPIRLARIDTHPIHYAELVSLMMETGGKEHFGDRSWHAYVVIANILEYGMEQNLRVNMFIDTAILNPCQKIFSNLDDYLSQEAEIIFNGRPNKEEFELLQKLGYKENISVRMLPKYRGDLCTLILAGNAYMVAKSHKKFKNTVDNPGYPLFTFSFQNAENAQIIGEYWDEVIKPLVVGLSPKRTLRNLLSR